MTEQLRLEHAVEGMGDVVVLADLVFTADGTSAVATFETDENKTLDLAAGAFIRLFEQNGQSGAMWDLLATAFQAQYQADLFSAELIAQTNADPETTIRTMNINFNSPVRVPVSSK